MAVIGFGEGPFDNFLNTDLSVTPSNIAKVHLFDNQPATDQFYGESSRLAYNVNSPSSIEAYTLKRLNATFRLCDLETVCIDCNSKFRPLDNIGTWRCRWHPGYLQQNGVFSCCRRRGVGCKRCDHSSHSHTFQTRWPRERRAIRVPRYLNKMLNWQDSSVHSYWDDAENPAHSYFGILRAEVVETQPKLFLADTI